jgi:hypothetical protein
MSLLDLDAIHVYQFAEWTDGISVLVPGGGEQMRHRESLDKVRVSPAAGSGPKGVKILIIRSWRM